jgi:hypothetical protein
MLPVNYQGFAGTKGLATWKAQDTHWFDRAQLEIESPEIFAEYWQTRIAQIAA